MKKINLPLSEESIKELKAGCQVLISGEIFTARDAAHKRLTELINNGLPLPFEIKGKTIYYAGPCPAPPGNVIGSCGPTSAGRCDVYTPMLIENGLKGMIGKGIRNQTVVDAIKKHSAVYFAAIGGAGALYAGCVESASVTAFEDLGTEAVFKLTIKDFPAIVAIDCNGGNIYN